MKWHRCCCYYCCIVFSSYLCDVTLSLSASFPKKRFGSRGTCSTTSDGDQKQPVIHNVIRPKKQNPKHNPNQKNDRLNRRRKSPALWREDLTSALEPANNEAAQQVDEIILPKNPPEVMAPAGGFPQLHAAIGNGADAVYLGLSSFSARSRASNFHVDTELPEAVRICHESNVKVYVAMNTLVMDAELNLVATLIQKIYRAGVDALIVQDLGVAKLAQRVAPELALHSSTQQTVTSADGVAFCYEQHNAERVVLGRELSVDEIAQITRQATTTNAAGAPPVCSPETEVFCHGALCVSYSGQCFSSKAWGGRSANRGQCAQACRLPYGLVRNGELVHLQDMAYLLSPQDLCGLDQVPDLIRAGVSCLKIEGRLKDASYVAATTRAYRRAVDKAWKDLTGQENTQRKVISPIIIKEESKDKKKNAKSNSKNDYEDDVTRQELTQMFARGQDENYNGLTPGFLEGTRHQQLVRGRSPRHRGVHVGRVAAGTNSEKGILLIRADDNNDDGLVNLKLGDGLVIDRGLPQEQELGGPIYNVVGQDEHCIKVRFGTGASREWKRADSLARQRGEPNLAPEGAHVWKTRDATVEKKMHKMSQAPPPRQLVRVRVSGSVDKPLTVTLYNEQSGKSASATTQGVLQPAKTEGFFNKDTVAKAIGTLGNTKEWAVDGEIDISELDSNAWCPLSWLKEARRNAVIKWQDLQKRVPSEGNQQDNAEKTVHPPPLIPDGPSLVLKELQQKHVERTTTKATTKLSILCRNMQQVDTVCQMIESGKVKCVDEVVVDFLEVQGMQDAVTRIRETAAARVVIASPRIIKPNEAGIWKTLLRLQADGLLVRSPGLLYRLNRLGGTGATVNVTTTTSGLVEEVKIPQLLGDFSLNAANALTALDLLHSGLERITVSYDLNAKSIQAMLELMGPLSERAEVIVHTKMPIFHTEHCVFARFLSKGNSFLDCGHVCTKNNVHLRDASGRDNLVLADMGCRNTVFSSQAQSGVYSIRDWINAGAKRLRVELVDEGPCDAEKIVENYAEVIMNKTAKPSQVWETLEHVKDSNGRKGGVSLGSFNNKVERRAGE